MLSLSLSAWVSSAVLSLLLVSSPTRALASSGSTSEEAVEPPPLPPTTVVVTVPRPDRRSVLEADRLHRLAEEALARPDLKRAIDIEKQAAASAPGYWLPHEALAYLYERAADGPSYQEALEALRMQHPPLADLNYAILLQSSRQYKDSLDYFERVLKSDPESVMARLGIAESYRGLGKVSEAFQVLSRLPAGGKDPVNLSLLADLYRRLGDFARAGEAIERAGRLSPDSATQLRLRICQFKLAIQSGDMSGAANLEKEIGDRMPREERQWMRIAAIRLASSAAEAGSVFRKALAEGPDPRELREYAGLVIGRAGGTTVALSKKANESAAWLELARQILTKAVEAQPSIENIIELAGLEERLGDDKAALDAIGKIAEGTSKVGPQLMRRAVVKSGKGYKSYVDELSYEIPGADCRCNYNTARGAMRNIHGVIAAFVDAGENPVSHVLFDRKITSQAAILEDSQLRRLKKSIAVVGARKLGSLAEMAQLVRAQDGDWLESDDTFASIPLQFPKLQAKSE